MALSARVTESFPNICHLENEMLLGIFRLLLRMFQLSREEIKLGQHLSLQGKKERLRGFI